MPPSPKLNKAIKRGRTLFKNKVKPPPLDGSILKPARYNKKLGNGNDIISKGKWKGYALYYLTLEERATCPKTCHFYEACYGNHVPFGTRFKNNANLIKSIESSLKLLNTKHTNFVVRLHVLGDFYSASYVNFWRQQLVKYKGLHLFGYTAHLKGKIHEEIHKLNKDYKSRVCIRFSTDNSNYVTNSLGNSRSKLLAVDEEFNKRDSFICPESTGKVDSCLDCGLCFNQSIKKPVKFLTH